MSAGNHRLTPSPGTIAIIVLVWTAFVAASLLAGLCGGFSRRVAAAGGILDRTRFHERLEVEDALRLNEARRNLGAKCRPADRDPGRRGQQTDGL
jgi:hypothetical protein